MTSGVTPAGGNTGLRAALTPMTPCPRGVSTPSAWRLPTRPGRRLRGPQCLGEWATALCILHASSPSSCCLPQIFPELTCASGDLCTCPTCWGGGGAFLWSLRGLGAIATVRTRARCSWRRFKLPDSFQGPDRHAGETLAPPRGPAQTPKT